MKLILENWRQYMNEAKPAVEPCKCNPCFEYYKTELELVEVWYDTYKFKWQKQNKLKPKINELLNKLEETFEKATKADCFPGPPPEELRAAQCWGEFKQYLECQFGDAEAALSFYFFQTRGNSVRLQPESMDFLKTRKGSEWDCNPCIKKT